MHILIDSDSDESSNHGDVVDDDDNPSCDNSDVEACSDKHLENEVINDTKKGTTFIVSPMLNGCLNTTQEKLQLIG